MKLLHQVGHLLCGFMMSPPSMQTIGVSFGGFTRVKPLYLIPREKEHHLWWPISYLQIMVGLDLLITLSQLVYSSRLEKIQEGYFTNTDILDHATAAMDILDKDYLDEDHVLIFDNASTHLKCEEDALSATKMPKNTKEWGITTNELDEDCNTVHGPDGKVLKMCVRMDNA
jgi:hypothetical protein